jgi:flagellar biosynthesis protein FlhB
MVRVSSRVKSVRSPSPNQIRYYCPQPQEPRSCVRMAQRRQIFARVVHYIYDISIIYFVNGRTMWVTIFVFWKILFQWANVTEALTPAITEITIFVFWKILFQWANVTEALTPAITEITIFVFWKILFQWANVTEALTPAITEITIFVFWKILFQWANVTEALLNSCHKRNDLTVLWLQVY